MSELQPRQTEVLDPRLDVDTQYLGVALNVNARFNLYKYTDDGVDIHTHLIDNLGLDGHETVVDVGCASGRTLATIRAQLGHHGPLIGVDLDRNLAIPTQSYLKRMGMAPITFLEGSATNLELPDASVDTLLALFMLYHVPHPEIALKEFARVVRPGGEIAVATSGRLNKVRHRQFEKDIAAYLGIAPPPIFSEPFDADIAEHILPQYFEVEDHVEQIAQMLIPAHGIEEYIQSLETMRSAFSPIPKRADWLDAINRLVRPAIEQEIMTDGVFWDSVERHYWILRNQP